MKSHAHTTVGTLSFAAGLAATLTTLSPLTTLVKADDIVCFGPGTAGKSRPTVLVKTAATTDASPAGARIGIVTTWDTGASRFMLLARPLPVNDPRREGDINHLLDLGLTNLALLSNVHIGPVSTMKAIEFDEDRFVNLNQAHLNAAKTQLVRGVFGDTRTFANSAFDAVGCDIMINSEKGILSIVDPRSQPIKVINPNAANPHRALYGSELKLYNGLRANGTSNADPFTDFDNVALYPGRKVTVTPTLLAYNGLPQRPVVKGTIVGRGVMGALRFIENKDGLWDTGAPTSAIARDLLHLGAGDAPNGKIKPKAHKGTRVIIEEIRVPAGADTLIFRDVQMAIADRTADCPFRIGMNVLERYAWLIDLHNDINIAGPNLSYQLKYAPTPVGAIPAGKIVPAIGRAGQVIVVQWTDNNGAPLLNVDLIPRIESKPIVAFLPPRITLGSTSFTAPADAGGYTMQVLDGARGVTFLNVGAGKEFEAFQALDKEEGEAPVEIPATREHTNAWDAVIEHVGTYTQATFPLIALDTNNDQSFGDLDPSEPAVHIAVDLDVYLANVDAATATREWFYDPETDDNYFIISDGLVYPCPYPCTLGSPLIDPLPGVTASLSPMQRDYLALAGEPLYTGDPLVGPIIARAVGQIGNGSKCIADFNRDGGIDGTDVRVFFNAWSAGDPSADINEDGGMDGADIQAFFEAWENASCD